LVAKPFLLKVYGKHNKMQQKKLFCFVKDLEKYITWLTSYATISWLNYKSYNLSLNVRKDYKSVDTS